MEREAFGTPIRSAVATGLQMACRCRCRCTPRNGRPFGVRMRYSGGEIRSGRWVSACRGTDGRAKTVQSMRPDELFVSLWARAPRQEVAILSRKQSLQITATRACAQAAHCSVAGNACCSRVVVWPDAAVQRAISRGEDGRPRVTRGSTRGGARTETTGGSLS